MVRAFWLRHCLLLVGVMALCNACDGRDHTRYTYTCKDAGDAVLEYLTDETAVLYFEGYKHHLRLEPRVDMLSYRGRFYRWVVDPGHDRAELQLTQGGTPETDAITRCERLP